jgi:hypothetical protein
MINGGAPFQTDKRSPPTSVTYALLKNHPRSHYRYYTKVKYAYSSRLHEFACDQ